MKVRSIILIVFYFSFCKKIHIHDPYENLKTIDVHSYEYQNLPGNICIIWKQTTYPLNQKDFIRTYAISRLFYTNLNNQSGSLKEILENGFIKKFYQDKIRIDFKSQKEKCNSLDKILISILENQVVWFPPQEFIQNPVPIRKGKLNIHFNAQYEITISRYSIQKNFSINLVQNLLPGDEYSSIERTLAQIYRDFIDEIHLEYWKIKRKNS